QSLLWNNSFVICRRNVICNNVLRLADALLIVQVLNDFQPLPIFVFFVWEDLHLLPPIHHDFTPQSLGLLCARSGHTESSPILRQALSLRETSPKNKNMTI
ncbi:hypothetical protein OM341_20665, partial [Escherichia albertii]|nr:hypothetical protein [Escherichia albertii]